MNFCKIFLTVSCSIFLGLTLLGLEDKPASNTKARTGKKEIAFPGAEFSLDEKGTSLKGWKSKGILQMELLAKDNERDSYFSPVLTPGDECSLEMEQEIALEPHHQYLLEFGLKGALFCEEQLQQICTYDGSEPEIKTLFPYAGYDSVLAPSPSWENRAVTFITPKNIKSCRFIFLFQNKGTAEAKPGADKLRLFDIGKIPKGKLGINLIGDPSFEIEGQNPLSSKNSKPHSGKQCLFLNNPGRSLIDIGNFPIIPPVIISAGIWAKGKGTLRLNIRKYAYGLRLHDESSPPFQLTEKWNYYSWEFPIALNYPETRGITFTIDAGVQENLFLDDAELRIIELGTGLKL